MPRTDIVGGDQLGGDGVPAWLAALLEIDKLPSGGEIDIGGQPFVLEGGVLRQQALRSKAQHGRRRSVRLQVAQAGNIRESSITRENG